MFDGDVLSLVRRFGSAIVMGAYKPSARFPNAHELSQKFSVNSEAAQAAIGVLFAKGLLTHKPYRGLIVAPEVDWENLDSSVLGWFLMRRESPEILIELLEARLAFEPAASAMAAVKASVAERRRVWFSSQEIADSSQLEDVADTLIAAHEAILTASANRFFIRLGEATATSIRFLQRDRRTPPLIGPVVVSRLQAVAKAVRDREPTRALALHRGMLNDMLDLAEKHQAENLSWKKSSLGSVFPTRKGTSGGDEEEEAKVLGENI